MRHDLSQRYTIMAPEFQQGAHVAIVESASDVLDHLVRLATAVELIVRRVTEYSLDCSSQPREGMSSNYSFTLRPASPPRLEIALLTVGDDALSPAALSGRACAHASRSSGSVFVCDAGGLAVSASLEMPLEDAKRLSVASLHKHLAALHGGLADYFSYADRRAGSSPSGPSLTVIEGGKGRSR